LQQTGQRKTRFVAGAAWMVAMRWSMRFLGLISSMILARLLAPEDFGLIAMAMILVALLDTLATTGVDLALIRERETDSDLYNAAWTIQVIQAFVVASLILGCMPLAVDYFSEPELSNVFSLLALSNFVAGFRNIGIVAFRKELDFAREFRFALYVKLTGFFSTITLAFLLQDYRALVLGTLVKSCSSVVLSYLLHPYRPRFSLRKINRIWGFSQWLLASSIATTLERKASQFVVADSLGATALGFYHFATEVGSIFVVEFVMPIRRALFPNLSILLDEDTFISNSIQTVAVSLLVCLPIGLGVSLVADQLIVILFGEKWASAGPILEVTALTGTVMAVGLSLDLILMVKGQLHLMTAKTVLQLVVLIPVLVHFSGEKDPVVIAAATLSVSLLFLPLHYWILVRALGCTMRDLLAPQWRPLLAVALMWSCDRWLLSGLSVNIYLDLLIHAATGALSYVLVLYALWLASGRPDSLEKQVVSVAMRIVKRRRA
jgi:lipopolysaccharide exporter